MTNREPNYKMLAFGLLDAFSDQEERYVGGQMNSVLCDNYEPEEDPSLVLLSGGFDLIQVAKHVYSHFCPTQLQNSEEGPHDPQETPVLDAGDDRDTGAAG